ncbi:protein bicaudal D homolog [Tissierella carlieri]|uniref:Protein bicaudal D homolog n=1 Tax=Tissierella carlieri TaxID=689904 RepID=A0ABT1SAS5_9FIRM|nr:protein bicaudal D homolog [Tissierella carlieri]MCQ4923549.1 protein bicaudal D homolog [Tissierella carlieri]
MFGRNISLDQSILLKNKIPLLYNDESWVKLFGDVNDKNIQSAKEELIQLVSKERDLEIRNRELQKEKLKCMKMILGISDSINNDNKVENIALLDDYKNRMISVNEELEELTFQLETIPKEIRVANLKLLNLTIEYGYDELKVREKIVTQSIGEIEALRQKLKNLIKTKHDYEEWINETYTFLHGLLGSEVIEKIDKERFK